MRTINVTLAYDDDARVWWVKDCDVQGVRLEGQTLDSLVARIPDALLDIWEASNDLAALKEPFELVTHATTYMNSRPIAA